MTPRPWWLADENPIPTSKPVVYLRQNLLTATSSLTDGPVWPLNPRSDQSTFGVLSQTGRVGTSCLSHIELQSHIEQNFDFHLSQDADTEHTMSVAV
jgi:hypothetical protein